MATPLADRVAGLYRTEPILGPRERLLSNGRLAGAA